MNIILKNKIFIVLILFIILFIIESLSFFIIKILSQKGVFFEKKIITQSYDEYLKIRDPILGWNHNNTDHYGARVDKSNFSKSKICVDVYGDSFTYSLDVGDVDAWPSKLSEKLKCRVRNYGVSGYGTDQAYLKYLHQSNEHSKVLVLNHFSEGIIRNINQFHNLIYPNANFALKPRFIIVNNNLSLIQIPTLSKLEIKKFLESPMEFLRYEYFIPFGEAGIQISSFPYIMSLIKAFNHYHLKAFLKKESRIKKFYKTEHKSKALQITELIMKDFHRNALKKNLIPIITIIPACRDFEHRATHGAFPYENLSQKLNSYSSLFIDFGLEIVLSNKNYRDLYINCSAHMNEIGNQFLAEIFEKKLRSKIFSNDF